MRTAEIISAALDDIPGLEPLKKDRRITQRGFYFYILRFDENIWGIPRKRFMEACNAEGAVIGAGYGAPVYHLPLFQNTDYDESGYPVRRGRRKFGRTVSFRKVRCPNAERVSYHEHLTIGNHWLNFKRNGMLYARVFRKLWQNRDELRKG